MTIDPPISNAQIYVSVDILFLVTPLTIEMTMHKHFLVVTPSRDDETGRVRSIPTELFLIVKYKFFKIRLHSQNTPLAAIRDLMSIFKKI